MPRRRGPFFLCPHEKGKEGGLERKGTEKLTGEGRTTNTEKAIINRLRASAYSRQRRVTLSVVSTKEPRKGTKKKTGVFSNKERGEKNAHKLAQSIQASEKDAPAAASL